MLFSNGYFFILLNVFFLQIHIPFFVCVQLLFTNDKRFSVSCRQNFSYVRNIYLKKDKKSDFSMVSSPFYSSNFLKQAYLKKNPLINSIGKKQTCFIHSVGKGHTYYQLESSIIYDLEFNWQP